MKIAVPLIFTIVTIVFGQILVKKGMMQAGAVPSGFYNLALFLLKNMATNPYIIGGILLAFCSTAGWMLTLSKADLSFAYPLLSVAFPIVMILSGAIFGESIPAIRWGGMALIMLGIVLVSKS